ncbi:MAG: hypothetical protein AAF519_17360, partial [Bacteroidota bacterium]
KINQWWTVAVLLFMNLLITGIFVRLGYTVLDSYLGLIVISILGLLTILGLSRVVVSAKLETRIDTRSIQYRFIPIIRTWKTVDLADLKKLYIRKYTPFRYGGWGYFTDGKENVVLNARGNIGLQLVFKNNKRLLIGTQKAPELQKLLDRIPLIPKQENHG